MLDDRPSDRRGPGDPVPTAPVPVASVPVPIPVVDWTWIPKVELHCHLEGTMRPDTVADLAAKNGVEIGTPDPTSLYDYDDLTGFLDVFWLVQSVLVEPDDWERLAFESMCDGARHGLRHREAFFTPSRHLAAGQDLAGIVAALDSGLAVAERVTGATCTLIFDIDRDFGPTIADDHVGRLVELRRSGAPGADRVVGIGMDSTELGIDPMSFASAYEMAGRSGLRRTAHQGESSPAAAIRAAVDGLGCERIDHGISIFQDPELVARFADEQIPLTVCPSANVRINPSLVADLDDHVFPAMRDADLLATLNTDDPALVGLDLDSEYAACADAYGYDTSDMVELALDAVRASWLDSGDATVLMAEIKAAAADARSRAAAADARSRAAAADARSRVAAAAG
ncbi:adenosine deaminase [Ilumatobacter sp.]|uniref:adenosine deaminase n=1 Tax=Ilumatobacter sp. TaxID=1967498 RepID=UPI003B5265B8